MKSHASVLLGLVNSIYKDAVAKCTDVSFDEMDLKTIRSRFNHEGMSFLTITLPTLGSDLEQVLALGSVDPTHFRSFKKCGKAPAFLRGFFDHVIDSQTGRSFDNVDPEIIEGIRQIAYAFKKIELPCTVERTKAALDTYVKTEDIFQEPLAQADQDEFIAVSRILWSGMFGSINPLTTIPRHGPGATAEKLSGNAKFNAERWHDRLEPYFPLFSHRFSSESAYDTEEFKAITIVPLEEEQPVKVTPVPKTLKGPRIIAIEPVCMQYAQQALAREIVHTLETERLTAGHINFTDQSVNRRLAIMSSSSQTYATLDLSAASDRVPYGLALRMFDANPDLQGAIDACRSKHAELPDGSILPLRKFASMGSALCFPVEAMYFYTCCVKALLEARGLPVTYLHVLRVSKDIFVYGDDIIVPTHEAVVVSDTLQKYYCKVNTTKSFFSGSFRESCGMDAYNGYEVTPTYLRRTTPRNKRDSKQIISWIETANLFYKRGYWKTSTYMFNIVEKLTGKLPIVHENSAGLGKVSFQRYVSTSRWGRRYQRFEVKTLVPSPIKRRDPLTGYNALLKSLLLLEAPLGSSEVQKDHLKRSARRGDVALKRRWISSH